MSDNCCQFCVPPKRYPGCHDHCPERAEWKRIRDRQKAEYAKKHEIDGYFLMDYEVADMIYDCIDNAPTVDAVEVVHGQWIDIQFNPILKSMVATCSHCKVRGNVRVKSNECGFAVPDSDYCPNCGALMDGKREDGVGHA